MSQSSSSDPKPHIELYSGSKNYWRLRTNVDFHLILYPDYDVVEIICFNPVLHMEAPRVYVSMAKYLSSVDKTKMEEIAAKKREEFSRKRLRVSADEINQVAARESIVDFILARAQVVLDTAQQTFELQIIPFVGDTVNDDQQLSMIVPQPESLTSKEVKRAGKLRRFV